MNDRRPGYGNAFEYDRILNVYFYTSNTAKLLQARFLFIRHGYELKHFKGSREPYDEDYALGTEMLLTRAVRQVNAEFGFRSIFFVEDTSVRIECLSKSADFPGLAVKDWFASTTFEQVDKEIQRHGGNRGAKISSDIALYLPTLTRPLFFHGETTGHIATSPPAFEASIQYPWLTPSTFNGWFIPERTSKRLGAMEFEESLPYDFRAKSITALLARLEELNAALNMRSNYYTVRRPEHFYQGQLPFHPEQKRNVLVVIGHKCAGKTTFSDHVAEREGVQVCEASYVLRHLAEQEGKDLIDSQDAFSFLNERGWDMVARKIAEYVEKANSNWNVVTGLRTPEELLCLKKFFPDCYVILVDADSRIRFERHIRRARDRDVKDFGEFEAQDERQRQFGALRIAAEIADVTIKNEGSIVQYHEKIDELLGAILKASPHVRSHQDQQLSELHRCLWSLDQIGRAASCEGIAAQTGTLGTPVRIYNTNRALKEVPEFAARIENSKNLLQYEITDRGRKVLSLLNRLKGLPETAAAPWELPFN
jgi:dephospho-CoA kinase/inosine/xanthosine triphosphate pyrophosphatase family protein